MFATIRRYESVDQSRTDEIVKNLDETLMPKLAAMPGFSGYYLIDAGDGILSSVSLFETSENADESTRVAAEWVRDNKFEKALPTPKLSSGKVITHQTREFAKA